MAGAAHSERGASPRRSSSDDYATRRAWIAEYFDRTAVTAWAQLTSDAPVGRVRATVRAGRSRMRETLLSWLPRDLVGERVLDAGCGTGALALELATRGADVVAIDLSPTLVSLARDRVHAAATPAIASRIDFRAGDMLDPSLGNFTRIVAMDSIIHYRVSDMQAVLSAFMARSATTVTFTVAPRTPLLAAMHAAGRLFPRGDRAPAIEPVVTSALRDSLDRISTEWLVGRTRRVSSGFYTSEAMELVHTGINSLADEEESFI
ncbi:MAG: magnesium protoporphyrin IX methyltransferase [bacterium]